MRLSHLVTGFFCAALVLQAQDKVPRYERAACVVEVAAGEKIECGTLTVTENRHKAGSRAIQLPVMIFRSRSATPATDPIIFLTGGPGNSNVRGRSSGAKNPLLDERDFILLEPRGTQYAKPWLECPAVNALLGEISGGRLREPEARTQLTKAAAECRARLTAAGADLDGYTSEAAADDIEDLRKALGVEKWNLYGLSYGTRLALTVLRTHSEGVRSVVLDSVLPPEVNFDEVSAENLLRSLDLVFDGCAVDRVCGTAYPDLKKRFADLVAAADRKPLELGLSPAVIRGAQVADAIYSALHDPDLIPRIPRIISEAAAGHYEEVTPLVKNNQGPSPFTWGLRYSIWCAEEFPFEDPARVASQISPALGLGEINEGTASVEECRAWNVAKAAAVENESVKSSVPTLIFTGEFDPDTPPGWGRQLMSNMPNAVYVEFRGRSHGAGFNACGTQIAMAFLRAPGGLLPVDCALKMRGADFSLSAAPRP
jgi:pimeloyl-ACP methyl ester carboxylesterase